MERKDLKFSSYAQSVDEIVKMLDGRLVDPGVRHILIVPDVYTFELEKRLFFGPNRKGAFDLEVTTFSRLSSRLAPGDGKPIGKQGALMLIRRICRERAADINYYKSSIGRAGFAEKLYDAMNKLRSCGITPDELAACGDGRKSKELALLFREYLARTENEYVDSAGRIRQLIAAADAGAFDLCHVYVALYDYYPAEMRALLSAIERRSLSLVVAHVLPPASEKISRPAAARIVGCPDIVTSYKTAAKAIREYVKDGGRYEDVRLVDETGSEPIAERILAEYGIPYYVKRKTALSGTELGRFLFAALACRGDAVRGRDVTLLAENYYLGCEKSDVDAFLDYIRVRTVNFVKIASPFTASAVVDASTAEAAERVRQRICEVLTPFSRRIESGEQLAAAIEKFLEGADAEKKTEELSRIGGSDLSSAYEKTVELVELFASLTGGEKFADMFPGEGDEDRCYTAATDMLRTGFEGTELSPIPNRRGTVQVGPLSQFRGERPAFAVVVGFNEGTLPVVNDDSGLLADADAELLKQHGLEFGPDSSELNGLCRDELWHFLQACREMFLTYCSGGDSRPSLELRMLMAENGLRAVGYDALRTSRPRSAAGVKKQLGGFAGALEGYLSGDGAATGEAVKTVLERKYPGVFEKKSERGITGTDRRKLFFPSGTTSVSAIESYYRCPYAFFLRYGLRINSPTDGKIALNDVGNLMHDVVEKFIRAYIRDKKFPDPAAFVPAEIERLLSSPDPMYEKYSYEENARSLEGAARELVELCAITADQILKGSFVPVCSEATFGRKEHNFFGKTVALSGGVTLTGKIDRVDVADVGGEKCARVIDYKTGNSGFEYGKLYYGLKIQTLLYLRVLEENGFRPAGAFYFPFVIGFADDETSHVLRGPYDRTLLAEFDSDCVNAEGKVVAASTVVKASAKGAQNNLMRGGKEEMSALGEYARLSAATAVEEILGGNVAASPVRSARSLTCDSCDYRAICGGERIERHVGSVHAEDVIGVVCGGEPGQGGSEEERDA